MGASSIIALVVLTIWLAVGMNTFFFRVVGAVKHLFLVAGDLFTEARLPKNDATAVNPR